MIVAQLGGTAQIVLVAEVVVAVVEVMGLVVIIMASVMNDNAWLLSWSLSRFEAVS